MLKRKQYVSLFIFCCQLILLFICLSFLSVLGISKNDNQEKSRDLIVGELLGKVDPSDLWDLIRSGYYPVLSANSDVKLEMIDKTPREVVFQVIYPPGKADAHPERIIFKFFESEHNLTAAVITDQVDFAFTESDDVAEEVHKSTTAYFIQFRYKNPNFVKMLAYNNRHRILKSATIRKALTHAINRDYIFNKILKTHAYHADGPISRQAKGYIPGLREYKFDPRKAIQLLRSENWRDTNGDGILDKNGVPFRIAITYEKGVILDEKIVRRIKIDWNKLGIDVVATPLFKSEIKEKLARRNYDVILMNQQFEDNFESFERYFKSTSKDNFLGYTNRTTDKFIKLYKAIDPAAKEVMFHAIQNQINKDHPAAFLYFLWLDRYFVNQAKFSHFYVKGEKLLPFTEWKLR